MGEKNNVTVVLKVDLKCEGCASRVIKCVHSYDGVDSVRIGDGGRITVVGDVDPVTLRDKLVQKTHKSVALISTKKNEARKENTEKKVSSTHYWNWAQVVVGNNKYPMAKKEIPVTTAVLKVNLHCHGCTQKLYKTITNTKGFGDIKIDEQRDLVTVTGAIEMKALAAALSRKLKRVVKIVEGCEEGQNGAGEEKVKVGHPYPFMWGPVFIGDEIHYDAHPAYDDPKILSDENPNACSVM